MSQITIIPVDKTVVLDGQAAAGVDMSGVDITIHAIQFNTVLQKGTVEFKTDPVTGETPYPEDITSIAPWQAQVDEATEIIYCQKNPKTFYSTVSPVGSPVVVTAKGWPQPPNTTTEVPPAQPTSNTVLYWSGTSFVWSAFPYTDSLEEAKSYIGDAINASAYSLLLPSDWAVVRQYETGTVVPADWNTWRQQIRDQAANKAATANACFTNEELNAYCQSEAYLTWASQPATPLV